MPYNLHGKFPLMTNIQLAMDLASRSKLPNLPPRMENVGRVNMGRQIKGFLVEGFICNSLLVLSPMIFLFYSTPKKGRTGESIWIVQPSTKLK